MRHGCAKPRPARVVYAARPEQWTVNARPIATGPPVSEPARMFDPRAEHQVVYTARRRGGGR
jgi:hypothetical protein